LEYGSLQQEGEARPSAPAIPSTLQDSLAARLDRLFPVKDVVRVASAIGREFSYDLLSEVLNVSEGELRSSLRSLIAADIVHRQDESLETYSFKHVLLQEAAYAMMLRGTRQRLHKRIAEALEGRPESSSTDADILAHHLVEAGEPLLAIPYLEQGAQVASARAAYTEARRRLLQGLELIAQAPAGDKRDELELRLSVALGLAASATQGYAAPEVEGAYQRSLDLSRRLGKTSDIFPALRGLCTFYIVRGALATARDVAQECLKLAESTRNPADLIESATALGYALVYGGALSEGRAQLARAVALYRENDGEKLCYPSLQDPAVASLALLAIAAWMAGESRRAERLQAEALELAERLGQPFNQAYAYSFAALLGNVRSKFSDAAKHAGVARQVAEKHGFTVWYGAATIHHAIVLGNTGQAATAIPVLIHMLALWKAGGAELSRPIFLWGLARCQVATGDVEAGLQALDEAVETSGHTGEGLLLSEILRLRAELLHTRDAQNVEAWRGQVLEAVAVARSQGAVMLELRALGTLATLTPDRGTQRDLGRLQELVSMLRDAGETDSEIEDAEAVLRNG
jgi:tetratricopeptide (TPR) repeat protein